MRESMEIIYPRTAAERAMKLQEVLLRATSGKIKWWQAAVADSFRKTKDCPTYGHESELNERFRLMRLSPRGPQSEGICRPSLVIRRRREAVAPESAIAAHGTPPPFPRLMSSWRATNQSEFRKAIKSPFCSGVRFIWNRWL